jgi:hypothetical protein
MVSNKVFLAAIIISVILVAVAFAIALNVGGLGDSVSGFGGPLARGAYNIFVTPFNWVASGGWPTLAAGIGIVGLLMVLSAYATWHYDIPYKITGVTTADNKMLNYTAQKEPEDPETLPKVTKP